MMYLKKSLLVLFFISVIVVALVVKNKGTKKINGPIISKKKQSSRLVTESDIGINVNEFVQWFRKSEICKINDFYRPCPWNSKESCLDTDVYEKALAILESKLPASTEAKRNVDKCIDLHKQRNAGVTWTSDFIEDEIQSWKEAHPNEELPKNFGENHWMDGVDDSALGLLLMMHTKLCPIDPVRSFAVLKNELESEMHFELHPVNNIRLDLILTLVRGDKNEAWQRYLISSEVVK